MEFAWPAILKPDKSWPNRRNDDANDNNQGHKWEIKIKLKAEEILLNCGEKQQLNQQMETQELD